MQPLNPNLCRQELSVKVIFDNCWTKILCHERLPSVYYIKYTDLCVFIRFFPLARHMEELTYTANPFTAEMCTRFSVEIAWHLGRLQNLSLGDAERQAIQLYLLPSCGSQESETTRDFHVSSNAFTLLVDPTNLRNLTVGALLAISLNIHI